MPLEEQELLTFAEHMNAIPVFSEVRVSQSLVFCEGVFRTLLAIEKS
jgi:hypothetical protein